MSRCTLPPAGWHCKLEFGHPGPCPTYPDGEATIASGIEAMRMRNAGAGRHYDLTAAIGTACPEEVARLHDEFRDSLRIRPRQPEFEDHGMIVEHDQCCAVLHDQFAVFNMNTGHFHPSWKAQGQGWRLVQAKTRWQRWLLERFFGVKFSKRP